MQQLVITIVMANEESSLLRTGQELQFIPCPLVSDISRRDDIMPVSTEQRGDKA